ncbi:acid protease [Cenococcum geophilum 1.58]|uniref:acid protease n=1 Tax=Cenococcum geophilum 1.58 TaxID=794803 RepID=UPI00358E5445|nr:acid protease [Cenococcum geophilum 1.58]
MNNLQRIKVIHNPNYKPSGIKSYVYLLRKFTGVQRNLLLKRVNAQGTTGEVGADDQQNDSMYLCLVQTGTPAQTLNLDFDTGSSDLWIQYGDSSTASGDVSIDNVTIGGLTIKNQAIELAGTLSSQFQQSSGDGLLGLAWGSINTVKPTSVATPIENMISQQDIPRNAELFTAYLGSWRDANEADRVDNSQGFWQFASISASVNGKTIDRSGNTAIADTGTTLALVDDATCKAIYDEIPGSKYDSNQQGYVFPTNTTADQLPVVTFAVGDKQFAVQKEDLAFAGAGNGMGNRRFGAVQRVEATQNLAPPPPSS